ncbi:metallophosphoesterase family protein [Methanococcus voltae]|uniref:Metallophosphoesterase n=1 Tax=Methanococcus voltae (strain ATCC BAA-1334 / A3) TaxID=456320 RepID=D7DUY0_METV3|nr:metallophosphoesterase [Methanococcus voltae]MCS3900744.1 Icc-related predicted phosphoesterase [Methanococcus voltae]
MRIIGLTDLHNRIINFSKILKLKPDLILISGDIVKTNDYRILNILKELNKTVPIFTVCGNWDCQVSSDIMTSYGINIDGRLVNFKGVNIIGLGGSTYTPFNTPNEYSEEQIYSNFIDILQNNINNLNNPKFNNNNRLDSLKEELKDNFILLSHMPPKYTMADLTEIGYLGSSSIRKIIEEYNPLLCACGHIHQNKVIDKIGNTLIVNPSYNGFYIYDTFSKDLEVYDLE